MGESESPQGEKGEKVCNPSTKYHWREEAAFLVVAFTRVCTIQFPLARSASYCRRNALAEEVVPLEIHWPPFLLLSGLLLQLLL